MFSATVMWGTGLSSCSMIAMPDASASAGLANSTFWPRRQIVPPSRFRIPMRMDRKVDLPAPLPPHRAGTDPGASSKRPSLSATTPPKDLRSPSTRSSGSKVKPPEQVEAAGGRDPAGSLAGPLS